MPVIPMRDAMLCVNCEAIVATTTECPVCCSRVLVRLQTSALNKEAARQRKRGAKPRKVLAMPRVLAGGVCA
jgi:hypothetical protein